MSHLLLAVDDHGQFALENEVDFFRRRRVGSGAAARQEVREAEDQTLCEPPVSAPNMRSE